MKWRQVTAIPLSLFVLLLSSTLATAHGGSLRLSGQPVSTPVWLIIMTGGGVIAGSFLLTSLATNHEDIKAINNSKLSLAIDRSLQSTIMIIGSFIGSLLLVLTFLSAIIGPVTPRENFGLVFTWVGWWAGYTMTVYLIGNSWPIVNPWRLHTRILESGNRQIPDTFGVWPSAILLLLLVWIEIISPLAEQPRLLAGAIVLYTLFTVTGSLIFQPSDWFRQVDPLSQVFRIYGKVGIFHGTDDGLRARLPGTALISKSIYDETPFIISLLWGTTFDGLVTTSLWNTGISWIVGIGIPPLLVYLGGLLIGYGLFFSLYQYAITHTRRFADTYLDEKYLQHRFALALVPIAAGYHLAHFLGYFLSYIPAFVVLFQHPFGTPHSFELLMLPGWFSLFKLLFILIGHILAIWVAHSIAFEEFTGRLQPIRSQYPLIMIMIIYTMISMWVVLQPQVQPLYL